MFGNTHTHTYICIKNYALLSRTVLTAKSDHYLQKEREREKRDGKTHLAAMKRSCYIHVTVIQQTFDLYMCFLRSNSDEQINHLSNLVSADVETDFPKTPTHKNIECATRRKFDPKLVRWPISTLTHSYQPQLLVCMSICKLQSDFFYFWLATLKCMVSTRDGKRAASPNQMKCPSGQIHRLGRTLRTVRLAPWSTGLSHVWEIVNVQDSIRSIEHSDCPKCPSGRWTKWKKCCLLPPLVCIYFHLVLHRTIIEMLMTLAQKCVYLISTAVIILHASGRYAYSNFCSTFIRPELLIIMLLLFSLRTTVSNFPATNIMRKNCQSTNRLVKQILNTCFTWWNFFHRAQKFG